MKRTGFILLVLFFYAQSALADCRIKIEENFVTNLPVFVNTGIQKKIMKILEPREFVLVDNRIIKFITPNKTFGNRSWNKWAPQTNRSEPVKFEVDNPRYDYKLTIMRLLMPNPQNFENQSPQNFKNGLVDIILMTTFNLADTDGKPLGKNFGGSDLFAGPVDQLSDLIDDADATNQSDQAILNFVQEEIPYCNDLIVTK